MQCRRGFGSTRFDKRDGRGFCENPESFVDQRVKFGRPMIRDKGGVVSGPLLRRAVPA